MQKGSAYRHLQVSRIAGALGAEVQGGDLARPLAPEVVGEIVKKRHSDELAHWAG